MLIRHFWDWRQIITPILILFASGIITACSEGPAPAVEESNLPTAESTALTLLPTPTLAGGVATPPLPTPLITSTAENGTAAGQPDQQAEEDRDAGPPTATPELEIRLELANSSLAYGDYDTVIEQLSAALQQDPGLEPEAQGETLYSLGTAYLTEERFAEAATMFNQLLTLNGVDPPPATYFQQGRASLELGDYATAIDAFKSYLEARPHMTAYVQPLIAESYLALGESDSALAAYEAALEGPAYRIKEVETRLIIAGYYLDAGEYDQAIAQYDAVHDLAKTEATQGQMTYLAGAAELMAGDTEAAYERFQMGIKAYPGAYESYLGLVELVTAEQEVDSFQRGLVDYNAAAYAPGVTAFEEHIASNPDSYDPQSHLYLAWSHEALGDLEAALAELDRYAEIEPEEALLEKAKLVGRAGDLDTAVALYQQHLDEYPQEEAAPSAAWWLAVYTEQLGDVDEAVNRFIQLADDYPDHEDAPEALYRAGWLANGTNDSDLGLSLWQRAAEEYPSTPFGSAAMVRLLRTDLDEDSEILLALQGLATNSHGDHYFALRAADMIAGLEPFESSIDFLLPLKEDNAGIEQAENWLLEQTSLDESTLENPLGELSPDLREDERLLVGEELWELGLYEEAKNELEALRADSSDSLLESYQLALYFRELGLFRSSIIAAATVLDLAKHSVLQAPRAIGRLAYPVYYADHIMPLSEKYGYDPRLQFALIRQESLFESFARSGAAAQGLSQVIPDTGVWIADQLQWPDYVNEDLYKPYVGLEFGAFYLAQQLAAFDGDVHAALAAYNAGPGNAARWYDIAGSDIDHFVDVIDFPETLAYVQRIYAGFNIYRHLYGP
ncbi:MAG: tetratricopeptide repeat protein [Candidatus Promineifilaceae bacterium]|nr:tetratricopeptide repeat protein [Candidatus Promineifilaceae bacterium]